MSRVRLYGGTSGFVELAAPDVSDDGVLTLPTAAQGILAANGGIGSNVVQTVKTDTFVGSSDTFENIPSFTATITPSSATSKILIIAQLVHGTGNNAGYGVFRLVGGNTANYIGDAGLSDHLRGVFGGKNFQNLNAVTLSGGIVYLDSPATTSPVAYTVEVRRTDDSGFVIINRPNANDNNNGIVRGASSITAIEVAA
jgi:hypothetical protein